MCNTQKRVFSLSIHPFFFSFPFFTLSDSFLYSKNWVHVQNTERWESFSQTWFQLPVLSVRRLHAVAMHQEIWQIFCRTSAAAVVLERDLWDTFLQERSAASEALAGCHIVHCSPAQQSTSSPTSTETSSFHINSWVIIAKRYDLWQSQGTFFRTEYFHFQLFSPAPRFYVLVCRWLGLNP